MKIKESSFQNAHIKHDFDAENPSYEEDKATSSLFGQNKKSFHGQHLLWDPHSSTKPNATNQKPFVHQIKGC